MKIDFCPACVNDFLKTHNVYELEDDFLDVMEPRDEIEYKLCEEHSKLKLDKELTKARKTLQPVYDKVMSMPDSAFKSPTQGKKKGNPNIKLVN